MYQRLGLMNHMGIFLLLSCCCLCGVAQPFIHAHNDYATPHPLETALDNQAFSIEADVYLSGNRLLVAHNKRDTSGSRSLEGLYLLPIVRRFTLYQGRISADPHYAPILMIDIKEKGPAVIRVLVDWLKRYPRVFDRRGNPLAVKIVLSGDRGPAARWKSYPAYIYFDGRPGENYDSATLQKVAFISDSWFHYAGHPENDYEVVRNLAKRVHALNKYLRLWGMADNERGWKHALDLGIDILNTDRVDQCRKFLNSLNQ